MPGLVDSGGVPMSVFAHTIFQNKYAMSDLGGSGRKETWPETADRVARCVVGPYLPDLVPKVRRFITERKLMPGGRYLYAAGKKTPAISNCFLMRAHDSREGWGNLADRTTNALMLGGGVGVDYSDVRPYGMKTKGLGGIATGPCSLMGIVNEQGRRIMQGGSRRSALWSGIAWWHPDITKFIHVKDWPQVIKDLKAADFNFPAEMDMTNISVLLDNDFFAAYSNPSWSKTYHKWGTSWTLTHKDAKRIYWDCVLNMLKTGEPGFSIDIGENSGETLRNACTEATSRDDDDNCNLASLNMARISSREEFEEIQDVALAFLLCDSLYGALPMKKMYEVREKNRRIGLGLMGLHEWLLLRGHRYEPNRELGEWMDSYARSSETAHRYCDRLGIARSIATRSVAPTGTIAILAETTSGIEPIMALAYKRRYLDGKTWKAQNVVDPSGQRIVAKGVRPDDIEDSLTLAGDPKRRLDFQRWLQSRTDQGISSTLNLPPWGSELNNEDRVGQFGETLLGELPGLRGMTAYPDGARGGQPITKMDYWEALNSAGVEYIDGGEHVCRNGVCGV